MRRGLVIGIILLAILIVTPGCVTPQKDSGNKSKSSDTLQTPSPAPTVTDTPTPTSTPLPPEAYSLIEVTPYREGTRSGTVRVNQTEGPDTVAESYVQIFHNTTSFSEGSFAYSYDLVQPPLIITLKISPNQTEREIFYTNRSQSNKDKDEIIHVTGDSPDSWMLVTVRDRETGQVVLVDGFGKTYSADRERRIVLRTSGKYQIDFSGSAMALEIEMNVKKASS